MAGNRPGPVQAPLGGEAQHGPRIYLAVERTPIMRLARTLDNAAWSPGAYGAIYQANLKIARRVQERAVELLKSRIVRPDQRTGRLEEAVSDSQAVYADSQRIIIGVGDFLDAKASYWRPVEAGAPGLQDRVVYGFYTRAPRFEGGGGLEGPIAGEKSGRPIVLSFHEPPEGHKRFFTWIIAHPTQAHDFFYDAWNEIGRSGFMEQTYREELAQAIGPGGRPINLPDTFQAYHGRPLRSADFEL